MGRMKHQTVAFEDDLGVFAGRSWDGDGDEWCRVGQGRGGDRGVAWEAGDDVVSVAEADRCAHTHTTDPLAHTKGPRPSS